MALGYQARIIGAVRARMADTPAQSKAALEQAVRDEPGNAFAVSALGGWHVEVVRGGGSFLAGHGLWRQRKTGPGAVRPRREVWRPTMWRCITRSACRWPASTLEKYRARIATEFKAAAASPPRTAYEKKIQERAAELLSLMDSRDAFDLRVRKYQGFPD